MLIFLTHLLLVVMSSLPLPPLRRVERTFHECVGGSGFAAAYHSCRATSTRAGEERKFPDESVQPLPYHSGYTAPPQHCETSLIPACQAPAVSRPRGAQPSETSQVCLGLPFRSSGCPPRSNMGGYGRRLSLCPRRTQIHLPWVRPGLQPILSTS